MDGTTEPIIAVLGHPIAGNPSQFAFESALQSMELDWRVVSFDVSPEDIPAALQGFYDIVWVNSSRAGYSDDPYVRRILNPAYSCKVCSGVAAPVA